MDHCELRIAPGDFPDPVQDLENDEPIAEVVLGGGCFWCVEAVFKRLQGVTEVMSGYAGGSAETANYRSVCSGASGHAEVIRILYQSDKISFGELLKVFFSVAHDPTQLNQQGNDRGSQYRSAVFYLNEPQRDVAKAYIEQLDRAGVFSRPIVTTLEPLEAYFEAESDHQDYADRNPMQPYIAHVARPKVEALKANFQDRLKDNE